MKLGFLGFGTIANAVARGLVADGHDFVLSERSSGMSAKFAADVPGTRVMSNAAVVAETDILFVGLLPDQVSKVLPGLPWRTGQKVISFAAGVGRSSIAPLVAPARIEAIMIPFPSIQTGNSPILTVPSSDILESLFGARNTLFSCPDETTLAPYMAAQAMLLPMAGLIGTGADWLAEQTGDAVQAECFLRNLIVSSLSGNSLKEPGVLAKLQADLSTPGGYNARMRDHLESAGIFETLRTGLDKLNAS